MTFPTSGDIAARLAQTEARQAATETAIGYMTKILEDVQEDAKFLRRTIMTTLISLFSAGFLALLGTILRALGHL